MEEYLKEYKNQKILTSWDIAKIHNKENGKINEYFKKHKKDLIKNIDYFVVSKEEFLELDLKSFKKTPPRFKQAILYTKSGYNKLFNKKNFKNDLEIIDNIKKEEVLTNFDNINNIHIENKNGILLVSSRIIAKQIQKRHDHILRDIDNIIKSQNITYNPNLGASDILENLFISNEYLGENGKRNREFLLSKQGFLLYMFNIQGYNDFKIAYIKRFEEMEKELNNIYSLENLNSNNLIETKKIELELEKLRTEDNKHKREFELKIAQENAKIENSKDKLEEAKLKYKSKNQEKDFIIKQLEVLDELINNIKSDIEKVEIIKEKARIILNNEKFLNNFDIEIKELLNTQTDLSEEGKKNKEIMINWCNKPTTERYKTFFGFNENYEGLLNAKNDIEVSYFIQKLKEIYEIGVSDDKVN